MLRLTRETLNPLHKKNEQVFNTVALLAAFCFFLSLIEYVIPKPLPFIRLGISNLPILLAIEILPFGSFMLLVCAKVIGMGLVSGSLLSYTMVFSFFGSLVSAFCMYALKKIFKNSISFIGVSVFGSLASNLVQIIIAKYVIFGESAILIGPAFLALGIVSGFVMGVFAERFTLSSVWYKNHKEKRFV